jgi:hypothetical protein
MYASITIYRAKEKRHSPATGYEVYIFNDAGKCVEEYTGGANPYCSGSPGEALYSTVKKWAVRTAKEIFAEHFGRKPKKDEIEIEGRWGG